MNDPMDSKVAESTTEESSDVPNKSYPRCWYFQNRRCDRDGACSFIHDDVYKADPPVCRFYGQGNCSYGRKCRFLHVDAEVEAEENVVDVKDSDEVDNVDTHLPDDNWKVSEDIEDDEEGEWIPVTRKRRTRRTNNQ